MQPNQLPAMNMDASATGCCPRFDPAGWDDETLVFDGRLFAKTSNVCLFHIPLNIGAALGRLWKKIQAVGAEPQDHYLILSTDPSPWRSEHYIEATKEVPDAEMATLSGTFLTKVFEGPFSHAPKWCAAMTRHVAAKGRRLQKLYFFYTTCPKCIKRLGKNYVVAFAQVEAEGRS